MLTPFGVARLGRIAAFSGVFAVMSVVSAWAGTISYGYNPLGRLGTVTYVTTAAPSGVHLNYVYDAAGNRTQYTSDSTNAAPGSRQIGQQVKQRPSPEPDSRH